MRFIVLLLLLTTSSAFAQNAANTPSGVDWKVLGRPLDDDTRAMKDRYVYNNTDTMNKNIPLDQAVMPQDKIIDWTREHMGQVMTLNGKQYDSQVYNNRLLFTPDGYADYIVYLKNTNLAPFLKGNQYKVAAYVDGAPQITSQGVEVLNKTNTYSWQVNAVMVLSYLDYRNQIPAGMFKDPAKADNRLPVLAKIELVRVPAQGTGNTNGNIIAINHLTFAPVPAKTESLDPAPVGE